MVGASATAEAEAKPKSKTEVASIEAEAAAEAKEAAREERDVPRQPPHYDFLSASYDKRDPYSPYPPPPAYPPQYPAPAPSYHPPRLPHYTPSYPQPPPPYPPQPAYPPPPAYPSPYPPPAYPSPYPPPPAPSYSPSPYVTPYSKEKCTTKEWSSETELCLPDVAAACENMEVRVKKVRDPKTMCAPAMVPKCKVDRDVKEVRMCNSKVINRRATLYATLYEQQMVVRCNTHYETKCTAGYGGYPKCYTVPVKVIRTKTPTIILQL